MKFHHYRNQAIRKRLQRAANEWQSTSATNAFETPESTWFSPLLKTIGINLLLLFPVVILFFGGADNPILLTLLFPFLAATTLSNLFVILVKPRGEELTYLLPFSDSTLDRQARSQLIRPFIKGLFYAGLYGAISHVSATPLLGALTGSAIFVALIGILTLSLLPRMSWLYTSLFFGSIALFFGCMISEEIMAALKDASHFIPWFQALFNPYVLATLSVTGLLAAWFSRSSWWSISPLNRTSYYETFGTSHHGHEIDEEEFLDLSPGDPLPKSPRGWLEKMIWKSLTLKERAMVRAVGGTSSHFLRDWLLATLIGLGSIWLSNFIWPAPLEEFKNLILLVTVGWAASRFLATSGASLGYLEGISMSPHVVGAQFQLLPMSLTQLEKLYWKETIPRALLASLTTSLCLSLWIGQPHTESYSPALFFTIFPIIITFYGFSFWNRSVNYWTPKKGAGTLRKKFLQLLLISGVLILIGSIITLGSATDETIKTAPIFPTIFAAVYLFLIRLPLRSIIKDKRCDLMVQT